MDDNYLLPFDLTKAEGQTLLRSLLIPTAHDAEEDGCHPGQALLDLLHEHGARFAILELGYVDQDYRDEFATFYAGCFADISSLCDRVLFFSDPYSDNVDLSVIEGLEGFLGYVVLRPLTHARIGRTVLAPAPGERQSLTCLAKSHVHLLGHRFEVCGVPFMQQTTEVTSCAQIAIWSAARYMGLKHGLQYYTPAEVNDLATKSLRLQRTMPTDGLPPEAMAEALAAMGLGPLVYSPRLVEHDEAEDDDEAPDIEAHRDVVVRALASGFPPLIVIEEDEAEPYHAVTAIGVTWRDCLDTPTPLANVGALVDSFVVNDDLVGPYSRMEFGEDGVDETTLERVILPLPKKVYLKLEDAEVQVQALLGSTEAPEEAGLFGGNAGEGLKQLLAQGRLLLNTYAIGSIEYKRRLLERVGSERGFVRAYLDMRMPKMLVVCELVVLSVAGQPAGVCGEVVMDSTAHVRTPPLIAVHLPGSVITSRSMPTDDTLEPLTNRRWHVVDDVQLDLDDDDGHYYASCSEYRFLDA